MTKRTIQQSAEICNRHGVSYEPLQPEYEDGIWKIFYRIDGVKMEVSEARKVIDRLSRKHL